MKKLTLVRHAKSSWKLDLPDHLRPLNNRGLQDAFKVSNLLKSSNFKPDFLISSNAVRAQTTANIFIENLEIATDICRFSHELYDFSGSYLTLQIKECSNHINHLIVFGHNDAITNFVNIYGDKYIENVPTCGVVTIVFQINSWEKIGLGETIQYIFPKGI